MDGRQDRLWPYSKRAALLAVLLAWLAGAAAIVAANHYYGWPDAGAMKLVVPLAVLLGLLPLMLVLVDFAASSRAVIAIKGVNIDFSRQAPRESSFRLPDNIGIPGAVVVDSTPMKITEALEQATQNEVAVLDLKDGNAWWVTRLLALCAGAVRSGAPAAIAFLGTRENCPATYLGWAEPKAILQALLNDDIRYRDTYHHAESITAQLVAFEGNRLLPASPALVLAGDVQRYAYSPEYVRLGKSAFEQVLMDQLKLSHELQPDRLTLVRLRALLEHCLYCDRLDLAQPDDEQIGVMLRARGAYVALVREGRYLGLLNTADGQRLILQQLFAQASERPPPEGS